MLAAIIMVLGYAIIAVPTGIVTAEMAKDEFRIGARVCGRCGDLRQEGDAAFCNRCGTSLAESEKEKTESGYKGEKER